MGRVIIIAEGQTEEKFVKEIMTPYFHRKGVYGGLEVMIIPTKTTASGKRHKGGDITSDKVIEWSKKLLRSKATVTTFLDYYGIDSNFIGYKESLLKNNILEKKECIENALKNEITSSKFKPYIQMYEFEGLLFSDVDEFEWIDLDKSMIPPLKAEVESFETPEHVNNSQQTAPSKRIEKYYPQYGKVIDGNLIADVIGIEKIKEKCPLFKGWIEMIEGELRDEK